MRPWRDVLPMTRILPSLLAILLIYLCWKLATVFWLFVAPAQAPKIESVQMGSQQAQLPNIQSFALFNEQTALASADLGQIKLKGVLLSQPADLSSAVIQIEQSMERYRVGQMLGQTGYQLQSVFWDRVILSQANGTRQELLFDQLPELNQSLPTTAVDVAMATEPPPIVHSQPQTAVGAAIDQLGQQREQYLQQMGLSASSGGLEINGQMPAALQQKLGLRQGDKIISLNGQAVIPGQEALLLQQIQRQGQVRLEVQRGDQVMTIQQDL